MIATDLLNEIIKNITTSILTPVIYLCEHEDCYEFVCFCDNNVTFEDLYAVGVSISEKLDKPAEVTDIREYELCDRIDIVSNAEIVFSQDPIVSRIFAEAILEDFRKTLVEKEDMLNRLTESGTYFLQ